MPKIFSDEEKKAHREFLLENGLRVIMENGYKHVTVDQLVQMIGASKGYFYVLFSSKEDFFLEALAWQMEKNYKRLEQAVNNNYSPTQIASLYRDIFKNRMHFATYEDAAYIQQKISDAQWKRFQDYQERFFSRILRIFGRDPSICDPKIVSNLSAVMFLFYNSQAKYFFTERMQETTDLLLQTFHHYIFGEDAKN